MLESGLFFTLGFLVAILLTLMIAPAIWRRAVSLTRKNIENSIPLTVNEIQAEKDQLRAEFAMNTRRLEVNMEEIKEQSAEQLIEINRRRDGMLALEVDQSEKLIRITDLETQAAESEARLISADAQQKQSTQTLSGVQVKLEEKSLALDDLNQKYHDAVDDFDGQKIEMVARETRLDTIKDQANQTRAQLKTKSSEQKLLVADMKSVNAAMVKENKLNLELEQKLTKLQSRQADLEGRLERRDKDIAKLRGNSGVDDNRLQELEQQLDESHSDKQKLESQLKSLSRKETGDANPELEAELENLRKALKRTTKERDKLNKLHTVDGDNNSSTSENADLRERIKELAAKVTALTAINEGPNSAINKALGSKPKRKTTKNRAANSSDKSSGKKGDADEARSLAGRIRALQAASE